MGLNVVKYHDDVDDGYDSNLLVSEGLYLTIRQLTMSAHTTKRYERMDLDFSMSNSEKGACPSMYPKYTRTSLYVSVL